MKPENPSFFPDPPDIPEDPDLIPYDGGAYWARSRGEPIVLDESVVAQFYPAQTTGKILKEARDIVYGQREEISGTPAESFTRIGVLWGALLNIPPIPPEKVAYMMIALKLSRLSHTYSHDSLVDVAGYAECAARILEP